MNRQRAVAKPQQSRFRAVARYLSVEGAMPNRTRFDQLVLARLNSKVVARKVQFLASLLCRFVRHRTANTTVEFGLLAAPFVAALFAILQTAIVFFAGQTLETAAATSA